MRSEPPTFWKWQMPLKGNDLEFLLSALASRVNNDQLRIADKYSDIYVPHPKNSGAFTVQRYDYEPNSQVLDLSSFFDCSKSEDYNEALDLLKQKPRLAVF